MLHAVKGRKSTIHTRYLPKHRVLDASGVAVGNESASKSPGDRGRVTKEDEITSTVLGPLDFLQPSEQYRFWRCVLAMRGHDDFLPPQPPVTSEILFWDSRRASDDGKPIEPDAVVRMDWDDGQFRVLLIELKWKSGLGNHQLKRQWSQYLKPEERQRALHLFIAPNVSEGRKAIQANDVGCRDRLALISWLQIRGVLRTLMHAGSPLGRWAELADAFLEKVQIIAFSGFQNIADDLSTIDLIEADDMVFWRPQYWTTLANLPAWPTVSASAPLFFRA